MRDPIRRSAVPMSSSLPATSAPSAASDHLLPPRAGVSYARSAGTQRRPLHAAGERAMAQYLENADQQAARAYSPAVITEGGRTVWLAGQTALRDEAGNDISGNFDAQVKAIFGLIDKTLRRTGGALASLVTMAVFINDPRNGDR